MSTTAWLERARNGLADVPAGPKAISGTSYVPTADLQSLIWRRQVRLLADVAQAHAAIAAQEAAGFAGISPCCAKAGEASARPIARPITIRIHISRYRLPYITASAAGEAWALQSGVIAC